jgi:hypothetical protein
VCVRGASALGRWLKEEGRGVDATVVWEPVLDEDTAPPAREKWVVGARNYWDPAHALSAALRQSGAEPACVAGGDSQIDVVWDAVFVYAPGARWGAHGPPPAPRQCGRTILRALPSLAGRERAMLRRCN